MATFLDVGLLSKLSSLFIFLLVLFLTYAYLQKTELLGSNKQALNAIIAFIVALIVSLSTTVIAVFKTFIPAMFIIFMIIFGIMATYQLFGVKGSDISGAVTKRKDIQWLIIIVIFIVVIISFYKVMNKTTTIDKYGNVVDKNYTDKDDYYNESEMDVNYETGFFNPKIIGLLLVLLIGVFAVRLLAGDNNHNREKD